MVDFGHFAGGTEGARILAAAMLNRAVRLRLRAVGPFGSRLECMNEYSSLTILLELHVRVEEKTV